MKVLAGIVLFNPDLVRLQVNIKSIATQVDLVLIIDNMSSNINKIKSILFEFDNIVLIENASNLGIATALKQIMDYAIKHSFQWVLTLDQDTVCKPGLIDAYKKYVYLPELGVLTCKIVDRNFSIKNSFIDNEEYQEIPMCITAASFINTLNYQKCNGFDELMFIDGVDFDMCFDMKKHGFKIIRINFEGVLQEVGNGRNVKLLWKDYIIYNHSSFRCYYMARNNIYLARKYSNDFKFLRIIVKEVIAEILIILYEKNRKEKIISRWRGLKDGAQMQIKGVK